MHNVTLGPCGEQELGRSRLLGLLLPSAPPAGSKRHA